MTVKLLNAGDKALIAPLGKRRNEKSLAAFIETQMVHYKNGKARVNAAAKEAFLWTTEDNGSANLLTLVYSHLTKNEQDLFRAWVGRCAAFTFIDADGVETKRSFIAFNVNKTEKYAANSFHLKSGKEYIEARRNVVRDDIVSAPSFLDKPDNATSVMTLAKLYKMLADLNKSTGNKAEKNDLAIDADVLAEVAALSKLAAAKLATIN